MSACSGIAALGFVALLLSGCGGESSPQTEAEPRETQHREKPKIKHSLKLTLSGRRGPEAAGLLMAERRGYFADVGLDVSILSPANPQRPAGYVVNGTDDLGVSQQPEVMLAKEAGAPIMAFGSLIPEPTAALIWLEGSGIDGIADLKGKTIAIPGVSFQEGFLQSILARAGLTLDDVTVRNAGYELVPKLIDGRVDVIFGGSENAEGVQLEARGLDPVIVRTDSLGIPPYEELVFIARTDRLAKEPQTIRDFMSAVRRGTAAAIEDPEEAANLISNSVEADPDVSREEMEAEVEATLPLLSKTGYMSPARANRLVTWMQEQGMLGQGATGQEPASAWLTNEYVR